jgi:hypothetical protein
MPIKPGKDSDKKRKNNPKGINHINIIPYESGFGLNYIAS